MGCDFRQREAVYSIAALQLEFRGRPARTGLGGYTLLRLMGRWLVRAFLAVAVCTLIAYAIDSVVYLLRGSPSSTVTVSRFMGVPLKGEKEEYDYLGSGPAPCAVALFPHGGKDPCWELRRYPNEWDNL